MEAEKVAREAAESRLRNISEPWLDLDRYLQASEVHLSEVRAHFSQLLRDPSTKPPFNPLPAYQPTAPTSQPRVLQLPLRRLFQHFPNHPLPLVFLLECVIAMTILRMSPLPSAFAQTVAPDIPSRYVAATYIARIVLILAL